MSLALIVDGSAIFFAIRDLFPGDQLDYTKLVAHIEQEVDSIDKKIFYTSSTAGNDGQQKFLNYLRSTGWVVRTNLPHTCAMIDQRSMQLIPEGPARNRLMRFDAEIAFTVGDLNNRGYNCVVVTDSFKLAEPLTRGQRICDDEGHSGKNYIAFFDALIDPRWRSATDVHKISLDKLIPNSVSQTNWDADDADTDPDTDQG